jgi:hypothetical protein
MDITTMRSCVLLPQNMGLKQKEKPAGIVVILYQQAVSNIISRLLSEYNIKTIYIPMKKSIHINRVIKDKLVV